MSPAKPRPGKCINLDVYAVPRKLFQILNLNGARAQRIMFCKHSLDPDGLRLHDTFTR